MPQLKALHLPAPTGPIGNRPLCDPCNIEGLQYEVAWGRREFWDLEYLKDAGERQCLRCLTKDGGGRRDPNEA